MNNTYTCAHCRGTFEKGWSDEEAVAEAKEDFGSAPDQWNENAVMVCDDCYQKMKPSEHPFERVLAILKINDSNR